MKKQFLAVTAAVALLASCEEKGPFIDFGGAVASDTTFLATAETAQSHNVMIEEFTGVTCPNCPKAHQIIKSLEAQYNTSGERLLSIGYYPLGNPQAKPVFENGVKLTKQDFQSQKAADLGNQFFGSVNNMPTGCVDRVPDNSAKLYDRSIWSAKVATQMAKATPVNLTVTPISWDAAKRQAVVKVRAAFTQDVAKPIKLNVLVIENDIEDAQESFNDTLGVAQKIEDYIHVHVMREILTFPLGSPVLDSLATKVKGRVYERTFIIDAPQAWMVDNCKVVATIAVDETADKSIMQSASGKLKQ